MITREIELKPGSTDKDLKDIANYFEERDQLLATREEDGTYYVIVSFENKIDLLAFNYQQAYVEGNEDKKNKVIAALAEELELRPGEVDKLKDALLNKGMLKNGG